MDRVHEQLMSSMSYAGSVEFQTHSGGMYRSGWPFDDRGSRKEKVGDQCSEERIKEGIGAKYVQSCVRLSSCAIGNCR